MKIILSGSLGNISKPLALQLVSAGHDVTVISSNKERENDIESLGASAAIGSLEDVDFLSETFAGADAVYAMVPPDYTQSDTMEYYRRLAGNYAQAIRNAGVKRVVHLSSYGADLDKGTGFILGAHHAETILNKLEGVKVTHLRPGYFYYNLANFIGMIKQAGMIGSNYGGPDRIVLAHPEDIAVAAAEELQIKTGSGNIRYIASDERTGDEIAKVLGSAIGKPDLKWLTFSDEDTCKAMTDNGLPEQIAKMFTELGAAIHSGILTSDYDSQKINPAGKVKMENYAEEFTKVYPGEN